MSKKLKISLFLFLSVFVFASYALSKDKAELRSNEDPNQKNKDSQLILYFGVVCPHCKVVEEYLLEEKIAEKFPLVMKEVYRNEQNRNELLGVAKNCGIASDNVGVPFLRNGEECLIGPDSIIEFFKKRTNEQ